MRTRDRLTALKNWIYAELCRGREMKTFSGDVGKILRQEPKCYLDAWPTWADPSAQPGEAPLNAAPGILVMLNPSFGKRQEEKRFDRYNHIMRPKELGQTLSALVLFCVYEDGVRLPGYVASVQRGEPDASLRREGTEEGFFALTDWMDEFREKLLAARTIPGSDLMVDDESIEYGRYMQQDYAADKRPLFYGYTAVTFYCYADAGQNSRINDFLR